MRLLSFIQYQLKITSLFAYDKLLKRINDNGTNQYAAPLKDTQKNDPIGVGSSTRPRATRSRQKSCGTP